MEVNEAERNAKPHGKIVDEGLEYDTFVGML